MHQCIFKLLYTIYPLTLRTTQVEAADCVLITSVVSNHCSGLIYVIITHSPYAGTVKVQRTKVLKKFFSPGVSVGAEIAGWYKGRALRERGIRKWSWWGCTCTTLPWLQTLGSHASQQACPRCGQVPTQKLAFHGGLLLTPPVWESVPGRQKCSATHTHPEENLINAIVSSILKEGSWKYSGQPSVKKQDKV